MVREGLVHDAGVVEPDDVVPVPGQSVAPPPSPETENVHGGRLLPEGAFGAHDRRARFRERQVRQEGGRIAVDRSRLAGFAGRPGAEIHQHFRPDEAVIVEGRVVSDMEPLAAGAHPRREAVAGEAGLHCGQGLVADPRSEPGADRLRPALFLAAGGRQRFGAGASREIGREGADVAGDVDVLGKPPDRAPRLRQRRTALEGEMASERRLDENPQGLDDPDVLLEQVGAAAASTRREIQRPASVVEGERPERRVSHGPPARSPVPPARPA